MCTHPIPQTIPRLFRSLKRQDLRPPPRPGPPCIPPGHRRAGLLVPKLPIPRFFLEFSWASMSQEWLKTALNHLFGHSKWSRNNYGRNSFFFYPFCIHG